LVAYFRDLQINEPLLGEATAKWRKWQFGEVSTCRFSLFQQGDYYKGIGQREFAERRRPCSPCDFSSFEVRRFLEAGVVKRDRLDLIPSLFVVLGSAWGEKRKLKTMLIIASGDCFRIFNERWLEACVA
jgi:hypothetical protein